jgi:hypothetical protein
MVTMTSHLTTSAMFRKFPGNSLGRSVHAFRSRKCNLRFCLARTPLTIAGRTKRRLEGARSFDHVGQSDIIVIHAAVPLPPMV